MQLFVTGHHVEVTAALRAYIEKRFERIVRHYDHVIDVHCTLKVEKLQHRAEAILRVPGNDIHADARDGDMYAAIDMLTDKLDRLVVKRKEKAADHRAAEGRAARH